MSSLDVAVFDTNTIHGYNPQYQDTGANGRYDAFVMHHIHPRPVQFHNEPVAGTAFLDHQGHIVPQNNYGPRLMAIANQIDHDLLNGHGPYTLANANARLIHHHPAMNFAVVTNYIQNQLMALGGAVATIFVDPAGANVDERLGGYFSVINWNPVNICRAPSDNHRNNYPVNGPDNVVALKLLIDPLAAGITLDPIFAAFLQTNIPDLLGNIDDFITACNGCLANTPTGYYQFNWANVLAPVF